MQIFKKGMSDTKRRQAEKGRVFNQLEEKNNLQFASGSQVVEHLDDVLGQRGRSGQMISLGLESVLICHPGDGVSLAIFGERVAALRHGSRLFGFGSDLLLDSALADDDSVLRLVAERVYLFLRVVVLRLLDNEDGTVVLGGGGGNGQEHGDQDHGFHVEELRGGHWQEK